MTQRYAKLAPDTLADAVNLLGPDAMSSRPIDVRAHCSYACAEADQSFASGGDRLEILNWVRLALKVGMPLPPGLREWLCNGIEAYTSNAPTAPTFGAALGLEGAGQTPAQHRAKDTPEVESVAQMFELLTHERHLPCRELVASLPHCTGSSAETNRAACSQQQQRNHRRNRREYLPTIPSEVAGFCQFLEHPVASQSCQAQKDDLGYVRESTVDGVRPSPGSCRDASPHATAGACSDREPQTRCRVHVDDASIDSTSGSAVIEPLAHSPAGAAKRIGTNERRVYTLIASGELRSFKEGKRRLIPDAECQHYVQRKLAEAAR